MPPPATTQDHKDLCGFNGCPLASGHNGGPLTLPLPLPLPLTLTPTLSLSLTLALTLSLTLTLNPDPNLDPKPATFRYLSPQACVR